LAVDVTITGPRVSPAKTGDAREAIEVRTTADQAEWDRLMASCPDPHLPQGFAYGEGKAAKGWTVRRAVFSHAGRPVAFATVLELRRFGLRLVSRVNRGPLFLDAEPADAVVVGVYRALRRRWRGPLLIAPALLAGERSDRLLKQAGFHIRHRHSWRSGRIDLSRPEADIRAGLASTFRNRFRKAEAAGAVLRVAGDDETFEWMLERHAENMAAKGFNAADATLLRAMRAARPEDVLVYQLIHEDRPVAGMSVVRFGQLVEYHIGWFGPEGRSVNAGNFLMWNVMAESKRRGATRFDVGGLKPGDGYTQFKRTMNPAEYELAGEWMSI
jgi:CelD/BcsL family acetyltransferase involved in cellulose biosynthesis